MSPQLSVRCMLAVIVAILLASALGMLAMGPVALSPHWLSAEPQARGGWLLVACWPLLIVSVAGIWQAGRAAQPARQRSAWRVLFGLAAVAAVFGALEHLAPGGTAWHLARIAEASACATIVTIFLAERLGPRWWSPLAVRLAILSGPAAWLVGAIAQASHGHADERLLLWLECSPLFLLPLGVWGVASRGLRGSDWLVALSFFCTSKLFEIFDASLLGASSGRWSGHVLAHLALAASVGWLVVALRRQGERVGSEASDAIGGASRTSVSSPKACETSAKTAA